MSYRLKVFLFLCTFLTSQFASSALVYCCDDVPGEEGTFRSKFTVPRSNRIDRDLLKAIFSKEITRVERQQPTWNSIPIKAELDRAVEALGAGDTYLSQERYWTLLRKAESTGCPELCEHVLACYQALLFALVNREGTLSDEIKRRARYVHSEYSCVASDIQFLRALERARDRLTEEEFVRLREGIQAVVKSRQREDSERANSCYRDLVDLAYACDSSEQALPYFAVAAYHSYLSILLNSTVTGGQSRYNLGISSREPWNPFIDWSISRQCYD